MFLDKYGIVKATSGGHNLPVEMSGFGDRYPLIDYCGRKAVMDQHRDTHGTHRWNTQREQLQANVAELHNTMDRLRALQVDYRGLIESVSENLREAKALELRSKRGTEPR